MEYKELERIAILSLRNKKQEISDENIGKVISAIMIADWKFDEKLCTQQEPKTGNIFGFRKMYIDFAIKSIKSLKNRMKRYHFIDDYTPFENRLSRRDKDPFFWKDLKFRLTNREYEIIIKRYQKKETLREIGDSLNLSPEGVNLIIKKSIGKIKHEFIR